jgi:hypothetical protein
VRYARQSDSRYDAPRPLDFSTRRSKPRRDKVACNPYFQCILASNFGDGDDLQSTALTIVVPTRFIFEYVPHAKHAGRQRPLAIESEFILDCRFIDPGIGVGDSNALAKFAPIGTVIKRLSLAPNVSEDHPYRPDAIAG